MAELTGKSADYYTTAAGILHKFFERGDFALVDTSDAARSQFEGCALNCGVLAFMHAYGSCMAERQKARQAGVIKPTSTILDHVDKKEIVVATYKTILSNNNAWIMASMQAHKTRVNFGNLPKFIEESWKLGIEQFKAEDS
jgi:hypothetical protein